MTFDVSFIVPARSSGQFILDGILKLEKYLASKFPFLLYEILVVTNKSTGDHADNTYEVVEENLAAFSSLKLIPLLTSPGKGAAIKRAMEVARGEYVFFVDSDFPFDLSFFDKALAELKAGCDFVTANRRLNESIFRCPVPLLHLVYRRHRLGKVFNRMVRFLLGISSTDTQAGMKGFSRRLVELGLQRQTCPTFFFDLEYFLIVKEHGMIQKEIPVEFFLQSEKSTVSLLRDLYFSLYWLFRIRVQRSLGFYGPSNRLKNWFVWKKIMSGTWSRNPFHLVSQAFRWGFKPNAKLSGFVPQGGTILEVGCGDGLFPILLAAQSDARDIRAIDPDGVRIERARRASTDLKNIKFEQGNFTALGDTPADCVVILDSRHEVPLDQVFQTLKPGGTLLLTVHGNSASPTSKQWSGRLSETGFRVMSEPCSRFWFSDTLFVCHKPSGAPARSFVSRVTADDWGLSPGVNEGILKLVQDGIVKRVSLMANGRYLGFKLGELMQSGAALGLHFDLTSPEAGAFPSKGKLLSYLFNPLRSLHEKRGRIAEELEKQLSRLEGLGIEVEHLDSHHHAHVLPIVNSAIVPGLLRRNLRTVRVPYHRALWFTRRFPLNLLSLNARRTFRKNYFVETPFYYPSKTDLKFRASFARKLSYLGQAEVIVHPAQVNDLGDCNVNDPYREERVQEYRTLRTLFPVGV